jgi:hypothetical protein
MNPFIIEVFFPDVVEAPILVVDIFLPNKETTLEGSKIGILSTCTKDETSSKSVASSTGTSGFSGVKTTGSHPNSGRYFENFNHRCTPAPPDGGQ